MIPDVKLISYTKFSAEGYDQSLDEIVAFCARVSNPENQYNHQTAPKLIGYLKKHKHFSPFEMVNVCLEIHTTRDIARQILRHRSFSFQEFSQRYSETEIIPHYREARLQDSANRQNSIEINDPTLQKQWILKQKEVARVANEAYRWAIQNGIAKEQARVVMPEGLTHSTLLMNGSLRSWIHYLEVRTDPSTQKEHREVALLCAKVISSLLKSSEIITINKEVN